MAAKFTSKDFVQCISCKHATFMQWWNNPVIAKCQLLHERQVAEAKRICRQYTPTSATPEIEHFESYT